MSWYEPNDHFAAGAVTNIFASRFNAGGNVWLPSGQDRTAGSQVPSLNVHLNRTAEEPSVAGGATHAGNNPLPWVAWRERDGATTDAAAKFQIFVNRGIPGAQCPAIPLVNAFRDPEDRSPEPRYPLDVAWCPDCLLVQLTESQRREGPCDNVRVHADLQGQCGVLPAG